MSHRKTHFFGLFVLAALLILPTTSHGQDAPVPVDQSAQKLTLPEGFVASLFAGEPDVVQPIGFSIDDRGRLWVVECLSYPQWITDGSEGTDRITIFEDSNNDGKFDSRKVFFDKGTNYVGIALGFGGVWVCATPNLVFIPDANGDDVPDGPPEIVLDGWDLKAKHNVFNGLTWGPDGWLYGCNGILSKSSIGKPGAPAEERVKMDCGVWRIHPVTRKFEVVASGTTNPWGLDFDAYGRMFITNCVIEHLFHVIPGAHYKRMFGQDLNQHTYGLIQSCADHIHWGGGKWQESRGGKGKHDKPGGGHAHVGAMVYLGDNWPKKYVGGLFTCNVHGNRINHDIFEREGSGVVAKHGVDFMHANDSWFRGLELQYGPDGSVFVTDWSDTDECHDYKDIHRENGRIYKISYGKTSSTPVDVASMSDEELVRLQLHENAWYSRHARRVLQERTVDGKLGNNVRSQLTEIVKTNSDVTRKLRAIWGLHVTGGIDEKQTLELLNHKQEHIRGWAIQLELEDGSASKKVLNRLATMAKDDPSSMVRLYLASGLQRLPLNDRWTIAEELIAHSEDVDDHNLPLMNWYAIEPLVAADKTRAVGLISKTKIPLLREYIARRIAAAAK